MSTFSAYQKQAEKTNTSAKKNIVVQPKLTVNTPNDRYEQEANAVADSVMRTAAPNTEGVVSPTNQLAISRLQRKESNNADENRSAPPIVSDVVSSSGNALDKSTQQFMESRMGQDFSRVQIHTGSKAAESAQAIQALAYTSGNHIVFNHGQYQPNTEGGKKLLAHELVHTLQQTVSAQNMIQKFDSPEHVAVGDAGGQSVSGFILLNAHDRDLPNRTAPVNQWSQNMQTLFNNGTPQQKRFLQSGLSYGEIVALSGDFYETFEHLNRAPLREIYDLLPLITNHATTEQLQSATGGRYMALAERNDAHFSIVSPTSGHRNNMATWRHRHIQAIMAAVQGNANLAYGINAAADHFLTDRFAAGHILTPRVDFSRTGGVTALTHHDIDNQNGLNVSNLRGNSWVAYGDEMWNTPQNIDNRRYTTEAVQVSARDITNALSQRNAYPIPNEHTIFDAETIVPQINTATQRVQHDRTRMASGLAHRASGLPGVVSEGLGGADNLVRDWINRIDNAGIRAQPPIEQVRMIQTLLSGSISIEDVDVIIRICENLVPIAAGEIRGRLQRYYTHRDFGIRLRIRRALEALPH